jgi:hypothetical protein
MKREDITEMQRRVGAEPDGFWGPRSIAACQAHLKGLMPRPRRFPTQAQVTGGGSVFGAPAQPRMREIELPFPLQLYGDAGKPVRRVSAHEACAESLRKVFERLGAAYRTEQARKAAGILDYYGIYNPRRMRGGRAWSMHAWAIAIDLDAGRNGNSTSWPARASMPLEVMECFAAEGWTPAGAFWGRDAMHFQATGI